MVNNYSIFDVDIKPKGFRVIEFDGYITDATVQHARQVLTNPRLACEMVELNYHLARRHFSYSVLQPPPAHPARRVISEKTMTMIGAYP